MEKFRMLSWWKRRPSRIEQLCFATLSFTLAHRELFWEDDLLAKSDLDDLRVRNMGTGTHPRLTACELKEKEFQLLVV